MESKDIKKCIRDIVHFPYMCKELHNISGTEIFKRTNYTKFYENIYIEDIYNELRKRKQLIDEWLLYSGDKRCTPSWGMQKYQTEYYEVFYMTRENRVKYSIRFLNKYHACAMMVRMEMEKMRTSGNERK